MSGSGGASATQVEDINNDGLVDIVVTEAYGLPGKVMWVKNLFPERKVFGRAISLVSKYTRMRVP